MTDYGHDLTFGVFVTPSAQAPDDVVALAQSAETLGFDMITLQDHPYNAGFLDAFTLMTWIAASTERIGVAGNVLNLPLRPPAMLARAAASLDLLSHGRFTMGLGGGAFWDPIANMGGPRLSPKDTVASVSEAIDIMRAIWAESGPRKVQHHGDIYTIPGMQRGPVPAHEIDIWLGAYKPRMLKMIGAKANGWLPSLGYLAIEDIPAANATIDEAAIAAGRDPREIRRVLNLMQGSFQQANGGFLQGPPTQWVEELADLSLNHGFGTFIYTGDNPYAMALFAEDVIPALRETVANERARNGTETGPIRSQRALSLRSPGITYADLPDSLASKAVEPGDFGYERTRHTYMHSGSPGLVIFAESTDDVVSALAYARQQPVPLSIRSGGHGISGRSTNAGGIVIDLSRMNAVEVIDRETRRVRVQPGAVWGDVADVLSPVGLALSSGDYGDVGVGGLATTGGVGYMSRKFGLTIDHLVAAEIVTADGSVLRADEHQNADLLWGIRGAGGNLGVVTSFEFIADEVGDVVYAILIADATNTARQIETWGRLVEEAPRELTSFISMVPESRENPAIAYITLIYAGDDTEAASDAILPFFQQMGPILQQQAQLIPYSAIMAKNDGQHTGQGLDATRTGLVDHLTPAIAQAMEAMLTNRDTPFLQVRAVGGAVNDVPADATAYAHRHQNFSISASTTGNRLPRLNRQWARIEPFVEGIYLSFESGTSPELLERAFPGETLTRLRDLKARFDPDNVFNQNFGITPAAAPIAL